MRRHVLPLIAFALIIMSVSAQQPQQGADHMNPSPLAQVTIEGKHVKGDNVLIHKGITYVSVPALAQALGAAVSSQGQVTVLSRPATPEPACGTVPDAKKLSDAYRRVAVRIPDEVESLRALVKQSAVIPGASFDEVDRQISEAEFRAQTDADKSVSYALSHANNALAIMYFKLLRGVPPEYAKQGEFDSVLCAMESKFALQVGRLSGEESCSVFHSSVSELELKTTANK